MSFSRTDKKMKGRIGLDHEVLEFLKLCGGRDGSSRFRSMITGKDVGYHWHHLIARIPRFLGYGDKVS